MKKLLVLLCCVCMLATMVACKKEEEQKEQNVQEEQKADTNTEVETDAEKTEEPTAEPEEEKAVEMYADFTNGQPKGFEVANGWTNGSMFNVTWRKANVTFENGNINIASTTMETIGTDIYMGDSTGALIGQYNPDNQTITIFTNGVDLVFELGAPQ